MTSEEFFYRKFPQEGLLSLELENICLKASSSCVSSFLFFGPKNAGKGAIISHVVNKIVEPTMTMKLGADVITNPNPVQYFVDSIATLHSFLKQNSQERQIATVTVDADSLFFSNILSSISLTNISTNSKPSLHQFNVFPHLLKDEIVSLKQIQDTNNVIIFFFYTNDPLFFPEELIEVCGTIPIYIPLPTKDERRNYLKYQFSSALSKINDLQKSKNAEKLISEDTILLRFINDDKVITKVSEESAKYSFDRMNKCIENFLSSYVRITAKQSLLMSFTNLSELAHAIFKMFSKPSCNIVQQEENCLEYYASINNLINKAKCEETLEGLQRKKLKYKQDCDEELLNKKRKASPGQHSAKRMKVPEGYRLSPVGQHHPFMPPLSLGPLSISPLLLQSGYHPGLSMMGAGIPPAQQIIQPRPVPKEEPPKESKASGKMYKTYKNALAYAILKAKIWNIRENGFFDVRLDNEKKKGNVNDWDIIYLGLKLICDEVLQIEQQGILELRKYIKGHELVKQNLQTWRKGRACTDEALKVSFEVQEVTSNEYLDQLLVEHRSWSIEEERKLLQEAHLRAQSLDAEAKQASSPPAQTTTISPRPRVILPPQAIRTANHKPILPPPYIQPVPFMVPLGIPQAAVQPMVIPSYPFIGMPQNPFMPQVPMGLMPQMHHMGMPLNFPFGAPSIPQQQQPTEKKQGK